METLFRSRPFKIRNADEYDVSNILNLFVNPINGLAGPFDYENSIIKGRMGSGKTMYLRANHAYYLSALVPSLIDDKADLILPVFIRLNDFQHIKNPSDIYSAIIIKVIEELTSIYLHLENMDELAIIQSGINQLPENILGDHKLSATLKSLAKLESQEYIEKVSADLGFKGGVKPKFIELSAEWKKTNFIELKNKPNPGIKDIEECYENLLLGKKGKILLLIDEAGSLDKTFFRDNDNSSFFEILMNQFRTASFIRTKIAVYPNSYSDMLTETRYGDAVILEDDIFTEQGYDRFRTRTLEMILNYINPNTMEKNCFVATDLFDLNPESTSGDAIEQIIYASNGNMRRMMQLLDLTLDVAYSENNCATLVKKEHALMALINHANKSESEFCSNDLELLNSIANVCRSRGAFRFQFPNVPLYKYTNRSQEYNLINVLQSGAGRRATTYAFDYSYAVAKDIPTHRMNDSEKIHRDRTINGGRWLNRSALISDELIEHSSLPGKLEGEIEFINADNAIGFILCTIQEQYFFRQSDVIESDNNKLLYVGKKVRFYPSKTGDTKMAILIEIL